MKISSMSYLNNISTTSLLTMSVVLSLLACENFRLQEKEKEGQLVASVGNSMLFQEDISSLTNGALNDSNTPFDAQDSANLVNRYVQSWVMKQLMLEEANQKLEYDADDLERRVADYRYALMVNKFKNFYVQKYLDSDVTKEEVESYYDENKDNFILKKKNIVKVMMLKIPKNAPVLDNIRSLALSDNKDDLRELYDYGRKFAANFIKDTTWYNFSQLTVNTPWQNMGNETQFLRTRKFDQISDNDFRYFLRVFDYKLADEFSPLEYVKDDIYKIILNRRKVELARNLEDNIYRNAEKEGKFKIY